MILRNASTFACKQQRHIPESFPLAQVTLSHWQQAYIWELERWLLWCVLTPPPSTHSSSQLSHGIC